MSNSKLNVNHIKPLNIPKFTLEQVEWLESAFPENTNLQANTQELYINLGRRSVVKRVRSLYDDAKRHNST